jgi:hypothetical protein
LLALHRQCGGGEETEWWQQWVCAKEDWWEIEKTEARQRDEFARLARPRLERLLEQHAHAHARAHTNDAGNAGAEHACRWRGGLRVAGGKFGVFGETKKEAVVEGATTEASSSQP